MAKFCGNCGTQLDDSARVCGNCGTPLANSNNGATDNIPGVEYGDPAKKAKQSKIIKLGVALVALIVVTVIVINIVSGFVGYKGMVRKFMAAYEDYDVDALASMTSDLRLDVFDKYGDDYYEDYYENIIYNALDYFEEEVGHDFKLSYKITDAYKMTERKVDKMFEVAEEYVEDPEDYGISEVMSIELEVTAKSGKKTETKDLELCIVKESGKWKLYDIG